MADAPRQFTLGNMPSIKESITPKASDLSNLEQLTFTGEEEGETGASEISLSMYVYSWRIEHVLKGGTRSTVGVVHCESIYGSTSDLGCRLIPI